MQYGGTFFGGSRFFVSWRYRLWRFPVYHKLGGTFFDGSAIRRYFFGGSRSFCFVAGTDFGGSRCITNLPGNRQNTGTVAQGGTLFFHDGKSTTIFVFCIIVLCIINHITCTCSPPPKSTHTHIPPFPIFQPNLLIVRALPTSRPQELL